MNSELIYNVVVETTNKTVHFTNVSLHQGRYEQGSVSLKTEENSDGSVGVCVRVPDPEDRILSVSHRLTTGLRNFNKVIIPDSGRMIIDHFEPVYFWSFDKLSLVKNICTPLFIFTGQDNMTNLAFGIIGHPFESRFRCLKPFRARALSAYPRELELEIKRGVDSLPIPDKHLERDGGGTAITEHLYLQNHPDGSTHPWPMTLRDFSLRERERFGIELPQTPGAMEPLWCSWTDWHSDNVNEDLILQQVEAGVPLGIRNYIVDDGWFGPGLDSDYDVELNIGDWNPDPGKIKDVRTLSRKIRERGGRSIIWCAPHAVGSAAECFQERRPFLATSANGELLTTSNVFHVLCLRNPQAREIMADICVRLAEEYETDGAKYDLFNCIPDEPCCSEEHEHDTASPIVALNNLLALIWRRLKAVNPDYIVELKQNYGGVFLAQYGTMMRAGDTPYSPEGNFIRTAYIQGYTPYAMNDYMSITDYDPARFSAMMVIRMLAVGIPTYSMDICRLPEEYKQILSHYHNWYEKNAKLFKNHRNPLAPELDVWKIEDREQEVFFLLNSADKIEINGGKKTTVVNGSNNNQIVLKLDPESPRDFDLTVYDHTGKQVAQSRRTLTGLNLIDLPSGGRAVILQEQLNNKET